jgi:hypothetical protein
MTDRRGRYSSSSAAALKLAWRAAASKARNDERGGSCQRLMLNPIHLKAEDFDFFFNQSFDYEGISLSSQSSSS